MATSAATSLLAASDSFVVHLSEDAYQGDAQFTFSVDGVQVGGTQSVTALHSAGASQAFTFSGAFGTGAHVAAITFTNDAYGGTASTDRNLYVDAIEFDGSSVPGAKAQLASAGTAKFAVAASSTATTTPAAQATSTGTGPNSLVLHVSEDAYAGDAQFTVKVDGVQIGGVQTATASHGAGQTQAVTLNGSFGTGAHKVAVTFINDAWGGTAASDRNLYVSSIDLNGVANAVSANLYSNGTSTLAVTDATTTNAAAQDTLVLHMSEDAYLGDAQFTVSVDGTQLGGINTVSSLHSAGGSQAFTFNGAFGSGAHKVAISFLNDAYAGTASTDRNLYVNGIDFNGTASANASAMLASNGTVNFSVSGAAAGTAVTAPVDSVTIPVVTPVVTAVQQYITTLPGIVGSAIYVAANGSDNGNGSAGSPYASLQKAVAASEQSGIKTISVQAGTYHPSGTVALTAADKGLSIIGSGAAVFDGGGSLGGIISLTNTSGITLSGLTLQNSAGPTVLLTGASGNTIIGNRVLNSAGSGIELKDGSNNNKVDSNQINGVGAVETQGGAIYLHGASNNQLTHNLVQNTAGAGIDLADFYSSGTGTQNNGNTIAYNQVLDTAQTATDSGGIYILGRSGADTQNVVTMNFVKNVGQSNQHSVGIYLDDNTNGVTVSGNIITGTGSDAIQIHGGSNNHFTGNIIDLASSSSSAGYFQSAPSDQAQHAMVNNDFTGNLILSSSSAPRNPLYAIDNAGSPNISGNDYWNSAGAWMNTSQDSAAQQVNPNLAAGTYNVTGGAGIGFASIPQALIGTNLFAA